MQVNELTINQAAVSLKQLGETMERDEIHLVNHVGVLTTQIEISALCEDRITSANARFEAEMDAFYAKRDGNIEKADECAAYIDEMNKRIEYDRIETERINAAIERVIA